MRDRDKDKLFELYKIFLPIYYNKYVTETRNGDEEAIKDALENAEYAYDKFYRNIMPDISMCQNKYCIKKESCYRFNAIPSQYQSYSNFNYEIDKSCFVKFIKGNTNGRNNNRSD